MRRPIDAPKVRLFYALWRILWVVGLPLVLFYLWRRGRKDALYFQNLGERFGRHRPRAQDHIWVHAVSLGELRSAVPMIQSYLDKGDHVVTTHLTPAGRRASEAAFAKAIAAGQLTAVWVPFDYGRAFQRFFRAFRPRLGLIMEVEIWPGMIRACDRAGVPLILCNGQYPDRSYQRDAGKWISRRDLVSGLTAALVKDATQVEMFRDMGQPNAYATGEMRFDQPIPAAHVNAAAALRPQLAGGRRVICFTSVVEGEDPVFLNAIKALRDTLVVYVPRAPERFDETYQTLTAAGLSVARRSERLDAGLATDTAPQDVDVLLGDSLGEMYFYLALSDLAVVGGGFVPKGSHNIIEPLSLGLPVVVGPEIWTITYPAEAALAAGVARQVTAEALPDALNGPAPSGNIAAFLAEHGGAVAKTHGALAVVFGKHLKA